MKYIIGLSSVLTTASAVLADEAVVAAKAQPTFVENMVPFIFIFVLVYFLLFRPQMKKAKEQAKLIDGLQVGDEIVTSGGFIGKIRSIAENFVVLDLGSTTAKVLKEHVSRLTFPKNENQKVSHKEEKNS